MLLQRAASQRCPPVTSRKPPALLPCSYTLARAMGPGTRLCSDLFEVGSQLFRIEVYPAGLSAATSKYVSVFLTTPGSVHPAHLLYELAVVDKVRRDGPLNALE